MKKLKIHTDDRNFQLEAIIIQNSKPILYHIRKLTGAHKKYTVTERKMLSIVECLKEFRNI